MANVKPMADIANKWTRVTPQRTEDYAKGVQNPRRSWAEATSRAAPAYNAGIQKSVAEKRWERGVTKAGDEKWKRKATTVGPSRWAQGVQEAGDAYSRGFAPFHRTLEALQLPDRGPKGDPKNIDRVRVVADAMHKTKVSQGT